MPIIPEAVFVVLSDLHFGDDLLLEADGPLPSVPLWLRAYDHEIKRYFDKRCGAHDIDIVKRLPRYLKQLQAELSSAGYNRSEFDLYLVLGDHSTRPTGSSYKFLREYLTQERYETGDAELSHSCAGLNISTDRLVLIPGNHDKLLLTGLDLYQDQMLKPLGLGKEPNARSCSLRLHHVGERKFLFILVEASKYATKDNCLDTSCREHLASGEITSELNTEIQNKIQDLKSGKSVDKLSASDFKCSTRILLVHYAVDAKRVCGTRQELESLALPHECKGLDRLVDDLKDDIHLVIHGHLHKPKLYRQGGVPVIAATTTTQRGGENGFFLIKFFGAGEIRAEHHRWLKTGFLRDSNDEFNQLFGRATVVS